MMGNNIICTICARGGSKGIKNKNIRLMHGKPLIAYTLEQAREAGIFSAIAVSSDSADILKVAQNWGADYVIRRPDEMATDTAAKLPAIRHAVQEVERLTGQVFDICVDLDATSPLRTKDDICQTVDLLIQRQVQNLITAMPARRSPYFNLVEVDEQGGVRLSKKLDQPIVRRQDAPLCYDMNASIYVWQRDALMAFDSVFLDDTGLYVMPEERSIDIDSELDWKFVEYLMQQRMEKEGVAHE